MYENKSQNCTAQKHPKLPSGVFSALISALDAPMLNFWVENESPIDFAFILIRIIRKVPIVPEL